MIQVRDILRFKGREVWSVSPDASVLDAIRQLDEKSVGALMVIDDGGQLQGVISERDYARKVCLRGRSSAETRVREIMTAEVVRISPSQTVKECMEVMTEKRIRHLPVLEDGEVVGVVSIGDIVRAIIADQHDYIEQPESYITGKR